MVMARRWQVLLVATIAVRTSMQTSSLLRQRKWVFL